MSQIPQSNNNNSISSSHSLFSNSGSSQNNQDSQMESKFQSRQELFINEDNFSQIKDTTMTKELSLAENNRNKILMQKRLNKIINSENNLSLYNVLKISKDVYTQLTNEEICIKDFSKIINLFHSQNIDDKFKGLMGIRKLLSIESNPPIQEIIELNIVPELINLLDNSLYEFKYETTYLITTENIAKEQTTYMTTTETINEAQTTFIKETQPITETQTIYVSEIKTEFITQNQSVNICSYEKLLDNNCVFESNNNSDLYDKISNDILQSYPDDGESIVIEGENGHIFQITTLDNELSSLNGNGTSNISIIDLGDCGDLLKDHYNISEDQDLIFLKYEKVTEVASDRNIQYEIYHPIHKYKLNLTVCENTPISIYVPVTIPEEAKQKYEELEKQGYDLFNPNDSFYQDICSPFKSEDGTDVPLNDRKNDYYKNYNNNTQCQGNCQYSDCLSNSNFLKCECNIDLDNSIETGEEEVKFENSMIYESFYDILKNSNYKIVKCYNLVFNNDIFLHNYGSLLVIIYFLFFTIFFFLFIMKGIDPLKISALKSMAENQIIKGKNSVLLSSIKFNNLDINDNNKPKNNKFSSKEIKKESLEPPKKSSKTLNYQIESKRD